MADPTLTPGEAASKATAAGTLGTFAGVFTPSVLTILGIILFLRLGYVTGSAGIGRALLIIALANIISVLTSQSLAAIATNLRVKGGGDYYLISRTLGHQFGGAIGMVLYLAQSISVAFYCIGLAEALSAMQVTAPWMTPRIIAAMAVALLFILAWLGADWATRFQFGVMALLATALFSFFLGGLMQWDSTTFSANWTAPAGAPPFWVIFGIYFPAVTGFTQGVSMSGDLKDPGKSLPAGTFMAVGISILVYFAVAIIFAGVLTNQAMMTDYQSIKQVARYGFLIDAGVIAATLSSAMASFLGGPRILQSLAADRIFPVLTPFAKGSGPTGNPRRALLLTLAIALAVVGLDQLNLVARIVSMFFLISYGLLNYATFYEASTASPSFRPRFRWFNKHLSLLGFLICLGVILALDVKNGLIALAILLAIHQYLRHTAGPSRWADSSRDHAFQEIRRQLLSAAGQPDHQRNWRPHILAFTNHAQRRIPLLTFAHWIEGGSGLVTAVRIFEGSDARKPRLQREAREELGRAIADHQLNAFPLIIRTDDGTAALPTLLQSYGIGPMRANVVLTNWYGQSATGLPGLSALKFGRNLRSAFRQGYNLVLLHFDQTQWQELLDSERDGRRIDVWWCADASSSLMLLFAYLLTRNHVWQKADIRVLTTGTGQRLAQAKESLVQTLEESRIDAQPQIVAAMDTETIKAESSASSLVFLPFSIKGYNLTDRRGYSLQRILPNLPPTALVMAAEAFDLDAEPEEGAAGELAAAMDRLQEAERRQAMAEKTAAHSRRKVEELKAKIDTATADGADPETMQDLSAQLNQAEQEAEETFRKTAKTKAKADDAAETVARLGGSIEEKE